MRKIVKIILVCVFCWATFIIKAQSDEVSSFYFSEPQPASLPEIKEFDENHFGVYRLEGQKQTKLIVENDSIVAKYLVAFEMTMQEIDTNDKYYIKDELLFGIAPVGLHFIEEEETLLVALNQEELYCSTTERVVKKLGNTYYINKKESEGRWRTLVVEVSSDMLEVFDLDHSLSSKQTSKIQKAKEFDEDLLVYIASPTDKQFIALSKSKGYRSEPILYKKD